MARLARLVETPEAGPLRDPTVGHAGALGIAYARSGGTSGLLKARADRGQAVQGGPSFPAAGIAVERGVTALPESSACSITAEANG